MFHRVLFAALSMLISIGSSQAQIFAPVGDTAGRNNVPYAGRITAVAAVTKSIILIGTDGGGVWKTEDGGQHWEPKTDGALSLRITAIAASPNGSRVYAATQDPVRWLVSTNGGDSFNDGGFADLAFAKQKVFRLLIDPLDSTAMTVFAVTTKGMLRTSNAGATWGPNRPVQSVEFTDAAILRGNGTCRQVWATDGTNLYTSNTGQAGSYEMQELPLPDDDPGFVPSNTLIFAHHRPHGSGKILFGYSGTNDPLYAGGPSGVTCGVALDYVKRHPDPMARGQAVTYSENGQHFVTAAPSGLGGTRLKQQEGFWADPGGYVEQGPYGTLPGPYASGIRAVATGRTVDDTTSSDPRNALYVATDRGLWRKLDKNNADDWENLNGDLANLVTEHIHLSRNNIRGRIVDAAENGVITYRGLGWEVAVGQDAADVFLRNDDANRGGAFVKNSILLPDRMMKVINGVGSNLASLAQCSRPTRGRFALHPTDPSIVCVADGVVHCSDRGGYEYWCYQSADIGAEEVVIVDDQVAWARTDTHRVMRTTTGVTGTWEDVTPTTPAGLEIIAIVAPEFDPGRALIMAGTPTSDIQAYETTDAGISWHPAGIRPVYNRTTAMEPPDCTTIPCPEAPLTPRRVLSFGITFADPNFPLANDERWYVGTSAGLLVSDTAGNSWWDPAEVPHAPIHDIDTFSGAAALATGGRGVWIYENEPEQYLPHFVDCDLWCWLRFPLPRPDPWASWFVALSDDILSEIVEPRTGRIFRRGDQPFGETDFLITPGAAVMAHADEPLMLQIDALPDRPRPIQLKSGWNAVGIPSVLATSLDAVTDAAAQGITIESIVEGVTPPAAGSNQIQDFALMPGTAYWIFVCGDGGVWIPGAGSPAGL